MLTDPAFNHVNFDISWDEVAKYAVATPESIARVAAAAQPVSRIVSCSAPTPWRRPDPAPYFAVYDMWAPLWRAADARRQRGRCARATTSGSSTRGDEESAPGNRHTSNEAIDERSRHAFLFVVQASAALGARTAGAAAARPLGRQRGSDAGPADTVELRDLRLRDARHRPRLQADQPELVRHDAARPSCRRSRTSSARTTTPSPACGRAGSACGSTTPTDTRRPEDDLRVRAVRHRRRRGADDVPAAPRLRRARASSAPARPGARSWTSTSSRTSLEYWGPTGMVFFRNVQVRWTPIVGRSHARRSRSSARARAATRASTRTASSWTNITARFPLPDFSGAYKSGGDWGYVRAAGILRHINWDDTARRRVRPLGRRDGLGPQPQLEPQARRRATRSGCSSSSAKASRTT